MSAILDTLISFFEQDDWRFDQITDMAAIRTLFSGDNGKWECYAYARDEVSQCVFYSILPVNVPSDKLASAAEFITRANSGMIIGNFELNYEDREVRYKTSIDFKGERLSTLHIKQLVYANCGTMDHYLPGLMSVIYTDISPSAAIAKIERSGHEKG